MDRWHGLVGRSGRWRCIRIYISVTGWKWKDWKDDRTDVSSSLPSARASLPFWVSDGDPVPVDDSPVDLFGVACDYDEVII